MEIEWDGEVVFIRAVELEGGEATVRMAFDGSVPVSVAVERASGVSGTALRSVRVAELASAALRERLPRRDHASLDSAAIRGQGPCDASLTVVAEIHREASAVGLPPSRAVEIALGLPRTTASRWVRLARQKGFLS